MKKITLVVLLLINISYSQILSTDVITLETDRTLQFDINVETKIVTMTMVLPENTWLGIGLADDGIALGEGMGEFGDDAIIGGIGQNIEDVIQDRSMQGTTAEPNRDISQDWNVVTNTIASGSRTIVATRDVDTEDSFDYIFPLEQGIIPLIYAYGAAPFVRHASGAYGFVNANLSEVLSATAFNETAVNIHPNPVSTTLNINAPAQVLDELSIEVFNVLGKKVFQKNISKLDTKIAVSTWSNGVYIMKIASNTSNKSITKRFIKI